MSEILPEEIWAINVKYSRYWSPSSSEALGYTKYIRADLARGWLPIDNTTPRNTQLLLLWKKSRHVEDGILNEEGGHCLFDGQSLNDEPDYYMVFSMPPESAVKPEENDQEEG